MGDLLSLRDGPFDFEETMSWFHQNFQIASLQTQPDFLLVLVSQGPKPKCGGPFAVQGINILGIDMYKGWTDAELHRCLLHECIHYKLEFQGRQRDHDHTFKALLQEVDFPTV